MKKLHYQLKGYTFSNFIRFTKENKVVLRWQLTPLIFYGVYNLVSPEAVTMNSFFRSVRKIMGRPFNVPMPKKMLQWRYGEGGEHLLRGADVKPTRLSSLGYVFTYEKLDKALGEVL